MSLLRLISLNLIIVLFSCDPTTGQQKQVENKYKLIGGPCEGCEAVFEYGEKKLMSTDTLPGFNDHPEERLKVTGRILKPGGREPAENVILYIYNTLPSGEYETKGDEKGWGKRHGYNRGWIKTDKTGKYEFYTVMPGSYGGNAAHIHPIILEPNGHYYWISAFHFKGDPNLKNEEDNSARGGNGIVEVTYGGSTMPVVHRDIELGKNIEDY